MLRKKLKPYKKPQKIVIIVRIKINSYLLLSAELKKSESFAKKRGLCDKNANIKEKIILITEINIKIYKSTTYKKVILDLIYTNH